MVENSGNSAGDRCSRFLQDVGHNALIVWFIGHMILEWSQRFILIIKRKITEFSKSRKQLKQVNELKGVARMTVVWKIGWPSWKHSVFKCYVYEAKCNLGSDWCSNECSTAYFHAAGASVCNPSTESTTDSYPQIWLCLLFTKVWCLFQEKWFSGTGAPCQASFPSLVTAHVWGTHWSRRHVLIQSDYMY